MVASLGWPATARLAASGLPANQAPARQVAKPSRPGAQSIPPYDPVIGKAIIAQARRLLSGGSPWTRGCVAGVGAGPGGTAKAQPACIPYSWGAGHGTNPGPSQGRCGAGWSPSSPSAPGNLYDGPLCSKNHNKSGAPNGTYGLDCSGFTRWVYALVYRSDVLGGGPSWSQLTRPGMHRIPVSSRRPGVLIYYPGHVAIYLGDYYYGPRRAPLPVVINEPHAYDQQPNTTGTHLTDWVRAYARKDGVGPSVASQVTYYRYAPSSPTTSH